MRAIRADTEVGARNYVSRAEDAEDVSPVGGSRTISTEHRAWWATR